MKIPLAYAHRYMYHFTHIDNLPSILENGLLCTNEKIARGLIHVNVSAPGIQARRSEMEVSCGPGGVVHDYVPFYLGSINPMYMSVINSKNIDQDEMIFFAIPITILLEEGTVFTDASANTAIAPNFYDDPQDLKRLNWNAIDSMSWARGHEQQRHERMAEVLIHTVLPASRIHTIVLWNGESKARVIEIYRRAGLDLPVLKYGKVNDHHFFLTKYFWEDRKLESLITGPKSLKIMFEQAIEELEDQKPNQIGRTFLFDDIFEALDCVRQDFKAIKELEGIYRLKTDNVVHRETVSDHTLQVVQNVVGSDYYRELDEEDQCILELSAYLHDIGKGPASKWSGGIQKSYPDHPADGVEMIKRILLEDIETIDQYQIRKICLLVIYHDLIGDILAPGRNEQQLKDIIQNRHELEMLSALNRADVAALNFVWLRNYDNNIEAFLERIVEETGIA